MAEKISVTELNARVKDLLESTPYLRDFWVVGEISNFKTYASGHCYFTIKDANAQVKAVMFRSARARIDFNPTDSMKVEAFGSVDLYGPSGSYQFNCQTMRRAGVGELYQEYERLKKKLEGEGLFDKARKRPLPRYPKTIGVVTSPTGAVIHDILTTTKRLYPVDILLAPAKVQGDGSAKSIVDGIELLNKVGVDVIIVGRGGGSIEDLWSFNDETVVRAIAASKVPVISSVGHETDFTLADFVADMRAPTPTGAAELAVRDKTEIKREVDDLFRRATNGLNTVLGKMHLSFDKIESKINPDAAVRAVEMHHLQLDALSDRLVGSLKGKVDMMHRAYLSIGSRPEAALSASVSTSRYKLSTLASRPESALQKSVSDARVRFTAIQDRPDAEVVKLLRILHYSLDSTGPRAEPAIEKIIQFCKTAESTESARLDALNPYSVLDRGYSFVAGPDGRAITTVEKLEVGSSVTIHMRDGKAEADIKNKEVFQ